MANTPTHPKVKCRRILLRMNADSQGTCGSSVSQATDHFYEIVMRFTFSKMRKFWPMQVIFLSPRAVLWGFWVTGHWIKDDLGDDFYRSVAFVNTFESNHQSVFLFSGWNCVIDSSYNTCSFALVVEIICSTVTEKLDRELFTTSILFTFFQTFPGRLECDVTIARHIGFSFADICSSAQA